MNAYDGNPPPVVGDHVVHEDDPRENTLWVEDVYVEDGIMYLWVITQGNEGFEMREDQVFRIL